MFNYSEPRIIIMDTDQFYIAGLLDFLKCNFPTTYIVSTVNTIKELKHLMHTVNFDIVISSIYGNDCHNDNFFRLYKTIATFYTNKCFIITTYNTKTVSRIFGYGPTCINKKSNLMHLKKIFSGPNMSQNHIIKSSLLTLREIEILTFLYHSIPPINISKITGTSIKTISHQKKSAMKKLNIKNDTTLFEFLRNI